jgi:probable phosphoglycerate mutase
MIYFIRHGESEANVKGLFAGSQDNSPLTEKGRRQALETANHVKSLGILIDQIVSSPLKRTMDTAVIVATELGYNVSEIKIEERITEYDMGIFSGQPALHISSKELVSAQGAEDPFVFQNRVLSCVQELAMTRQNILLVSHAGVGRMLESIKEHGKPDYFYDIAAFPNGSVTTLDWIEKYEQ